MEEIFTFAKNASPLMLSVLLAVIIILLLKGKEFLSFWKPSNESGEEMPKKVTLEMLYYETKLTQRNHLHELPDMRKDIASILENQKDIYKTMGEQGQRLARVEGVLKINLNK